MTNSWWVSNLFNSHDDFFFTMPALGLLSGDGDKVSGDGDKVMAAGGYHLG